MRLRRRGDATLLGGAGVRMQRCFAKARRASLEASALIVRLLKFMIAAMQHEGLTEAPLRLSRN